MFQAKAKGKKCEYYYVGQKETTNSESFYWKTSFLPRHRTCGPSARRWQLVPHPINFNLTHSVFVCLFAYTYCIRLMSSSLYQKPPALINILHFAFIFFVDRRKKMFFFFSSFAHRLIRSPNFYYLSTFLCDHFSGLGCFFLCCCCFRCYFLSLAPYFLSHLIGVMFIRIMLSSQRNKHTQTHRHQNIAFILSFLAARLHPQKQLNLMRIQEMERSRKYWDMFSWCP